MFSNREQHGRGDGFVCFSRFIGCGSSELDARESAPARPRARRRRRPRPRPGNNENGIGMWSFDMGPPRVTTAPMSESLPVSRVDPRRFPIVVVDEVQFPVVVPREIPSVGQGHFTRKASTMECGAYASDSAATGGGGGHWRGGVAHTSTNSGERAARTEHRRRRTGLGARAPYQCIQLDNAIPCYGAHPIGKTLK
ncbi:hypothetical protein EVAR_102595_1 [Eumeta japonica]|uniref:Uncharacterized protein n=1 Tax=Eumeta variegata TaxID=151549 RepID=A0A4C1TUQ3_EUMVA|nr:hypothetical protein EVAR_102595_1 [Eumeta japonica]